MARQAIRFGRVSIIQVVPSEATRPTLACSGTTGVCRACVTTVPAPITDEKVEEGAADWHLAIFTADPLQGDTHIEIRNRLWGHGSKAIAGRVELIGPSKTNSEPLARAHAYGLKLEVPQ
jgi:hypothetical protein